MSTTQAFASRRTALLTLLLLLISQTLIAAPAKNVILMITDGAVFNMFKCTSFYQHGSPAAQPYDTFPVKLGCTTYALNQNHTPQGYDQKKTGSDFDYIRIATDSAAAAGRIDVNTSLHGCPDQARIIINLNTCIIRQKFYSACHIYILF